MRRIVLVGLLLIFSVGWASSVHHTDDPIAVYFTDPLAGLPHLDKPTAQANGVDRALIALIDSAQKTIDAALYRLTYQPMIAALERAVLVASPCGSSPNSPQSKGIPQSTASSRTCRA
jgi:hypothetical protein